MGTDRGGPICLASPYVGRFSGSRASHRLRGHHQRGGERAAPAGGDLSAEGVGRGRRGGQRPHLRVDAEARELLRVRLQRGLRLEGGDDVIIGEKACGRSRFYGGFAMFCYRFAGNPGVFHGFLAVFS